MDFDIIYLSFFVINVEGNEEQAIKSFKYFQTLDQQSYEESQLKDFLNGELLKISKRKVDRHPKTEQVPTKIGRFIVEPGHELSSNPNFNQFQAIRHAESLEEFKQGAEQMVRTYLDTSAVRGGVFLVALAKLNKYFDEPFVFILKCDFEAKVASISDESSLIRNIDRAITTKNMKSIMYPFMPEEGMVEEAELKLHQASHARYFEDFLRFVEYGESMPTIVKNQMLNMAEEHIKESFEAESEEREQHETMLADWAESTEREIKETWSTDQVQEATATLVEQKPDLDLKVNLDHVFVKALLSDFGETVHLAKLNGKYVMMIESDSVVFNKGYSPVEFLKPDSFEKVVKRIENKYHKGLNE
ncbi:hypothetical protein JOD43_002529 [Pullulanibacillus pueri]|uniref:DUF3898 domain-containing protein n=1 Tax=Pullulanibacillus pueri TaxID=1437324 RepID=A0A8J3EMH7_9BACL|nr:DUF3900 domain-containing protein [Pullulanibacillus pueri]MBM7682354.1 hypothetical protein [Pullulanibacillus pueri]GGH80682.1 hypothetical protein GCM10007096_17450 [Pullulanibacillus pueri]